jgi:phosphohistidine phosphatase
MKLGDRTKVESGLYAATAGQLLARLWAVDKQVTSVLVVAHNPGLQDLALELAGNDPGIITQLWEKFPTGAVAEVVCDCDGWSDLTRATAHVASLTVPRDLPK